MATWILRCPDCTHKFKSKTAEGPDECPACGIPMDKEVPIEIAMPFLRTSGKTASADKLYRDIEKGSEIRAQAAAEQFGLSAAEVSGLKVTNMLDNRKAGEISAPSVMAEQSRLESAGAKVQFMPNGAEFAAGTRVGPHPNAGIKALTGMQNVLARR